MNIVPLSETILREPGRCVLHMVASAVFEGVCFFLIAADQNKRRNPNWICRGSEAAVAVPNAGSGTVPVPNVLFGNCRLVRFSVLKLSAIHSILKRSVTFS